MLAHGEVRAGPEVDLERAREQALGDRLASAHSIGRAGGTSSSTMRGGGSGAEPDDRPGDEGPIRDAGRPADDDRPLEADAVRHASTDALVPARSSQLGELVVGGSEAPPSSSPRNAVGLAFERRAERLEGRRPAARAAADSSRPATPSSRSDSRPSDAIGEGGDPRRPASSRRGPAYGRTPKRSAFRRSMYVV